MIETKLLWRDGRRDKPTEDGRYFCLTVTGAKNVDFMPRFDVLPYTVAHGFNTFPCGDPSTKLDVTLWAELPLDDCFYEEEER